MESTHAGEPLPVVVAVLFVPVVLIFLLICVACSRSKVRRGKAVVVDEEKVNGGDCSKVQLKTYRLLPDIQITKVRSSVTTPTRSGDVSERTVYKVDQLGLGGLPADSLTYELEQVQRSLAESDHVTAECANVSEVFLSPRLECDLALAIANDQACRNSVFLSQLARSPTTKRDSLLSTSIPILSPLTVPADIKIVAKERTLL
ncbi:hypothetical protein D918_09714 [Trichuris suis]|nr:hypothetical protein D918_09714 [Trichuris suis]